MVRPRLRLLLVGALTAGLVTSAPVVASAPAAARVDGDHRVSSPDGILYRECAEHPYAYAFSAAAGFDTYANVEVAVYAPDGDGETGGSLAKVPLSGTGTLLFCRLSEPGTYRLETWGATCNADDWCWGFTAPTTYITMRQPPTRTRLRMSSRVLRRPRMVQLNVVSKDLHPEGFAGIDDGHVVLERLRGDAWVRVRGSRSYVWHGRATIRFRSWSTGPVTVRARTIAADFWDTSVSRPVVVPRAR